MLITRKYRLRLCPGPGRPRPGHTPVFYKIPIRIKHKSMIFSPTFFKINWPIYIRYVKASVIVNNILCLLALKCTLKCLFVAWRVMW